jgi:hypothetical protein
LNPHISSARHRFDDIYRSVRTRATTAYGSARTGATAAYGSARTSATAAYGSARTSAAGAYDVARARTTETYEYAQKHPRRAIGTAAAAAAVATGLGLGLGLSGGPAPVASAASNVTAHANVAVPAHSSAPADASTRSAGSGKAGPHTLPAQQQAAATVRPQPGQTVHARAAAASHSASHSASAVPARHRKVWTKPFLIFDSVTPGAIPSHHLVATYATGPFAVQASQVADRNVMWIDTQGSDPHAQALDIEPGDATPSMAATWVSQKLSSDPQTDPVLYTMQSEWPQVKASVGALPQWMQRHVRWWIADPTGYPHLVPGSNATQWYWGQNYDISTAESGF